MVNAWTVEAAMLFRRFMRLTAACRRCRFAAAGDPFLLALALPFIAR
jgi:hypothetical protein